MRKLFAITLTIALLPALLQAADVMTAPSKLMARACSDVNQGKAVQAFISVAGNDDIQALQQMGVIVQTVFDGFVTASIPASSIDAVCALNGVKRVSLARRLHLCNDSARLCSFVDQVQQGQGMIAPLTGKGVIIGVIDTGVDFNHINLCEPYGASRVKAVYMPHDSTGQSPVINGYVLPGSCYESPEQIAALTTDNVTSSHGTHTTGTAAGAYQGNGWHGVATEADIVACAMPEEQFTDANVANAVKYIFDYADRHRQPCVINMSIGTNEGPNDGTSMLCKVYEAMTGPGRICVLSAGNDGNAPICFHHRITGMGDTVTTLLRNQWGGTQGSGYVSMWSDGPQQHASRLVIANRTTGDIEYATPVLNILPEDSVFTVSSDDDAAFAAHFTGTVQFANALEPRYNTDGTILDEGRFHSIWEFDTEALDADYVLGLQYLCDQPVSLSGWSTRYTYFYTYGIDGIVGGTRNGSISDLATTDSVISVGAYCSRATYIEKDGSVYSYSSSHPVDIANFSSYGPDENGITRPDLCAPGLAVISSANRYNTSADRSHWPASAMVDGVEYPYYANQGTSMSAPIVTGAIALMLQLNPRLSTAMLREVLQRSCYSDDYVLAGDPQRWGAGKLDARAAIDDVLQNILTPGDVNDDGEVNIADLMTVIDILLGADADAATLLRADVNRDSEIMLADLNTIIDWILKN